MGAVDNGGNLLKKGGEAMSVFEALVVMIAFGSLVATITLALGRKRK